MMFFTVGLFLSFLICIFGNDDQKPNVWHPGQHLAQSEYERPQQELQEADYYEIYEKVAGPLVNAVSENQLSESPNNFYYYIVQNFFFGKPINELTPIKNPSNDINVVKCSKNKDCKKRGHFCSNGVCELKPHPFHSHQCRIDYDCKLRLPKGFHSYIPVFCDNGECKRGIRKPEIVEQQICFNDFQCINGGKCRNHRCVTPSIINIPTIAPLHHSACQKDKDCNSLRCDNGICKFQPPHQQTRPCKVDRDCQLSLPLGIRLFIPFYCNLGQCNMGIRKNGTVHRKPESPELQMCNQDSDCINGGECRHRRCKNAIPQVTEAPKICQFDAECGKDKYCYRNLCSYIPSTGLLIPTTKKPINYEECKTDNDCIGYDGILPKISLRLKHECRQGKCISSFIFPHPPPLSTTTTQQPPECKRNSDCIQTGIVCGGARYCDHGKCRTRHFSIPFPILVAATRKPCKDDSACFAHNMICGFSHRCENSFCVSAQSPTFPVTPKIEFYPTRIITTAASQDEEYFTTRKTWKCNNDIDCTRYGKLLIPFTYRYCDSGICKLRKLPTIATTHSTPVTANVLYQTTPSHSHHCKNDSDCAKYGRHPFYFPHQHCHNGVCKRGRRPTTATTTQAPVTEVSLPQTTTTTHPRHCQNDNDCLKFVEFRHKMLVSVFCVEGHCTLSPETNEATTETLKSTSLEPEMEIPLITYRPLESLLTKKPLHEYTCKKNSDCPFVDFHSLNSRIRCIEGKCVKKRRSHRNTTIHNPTAKPHVEHHNTIPEKIQSSTVEPVGPFDGHRTTVTKSHGPAHTTPHVYTCRRNRDCANYPHPKDMPVYCEHRLCKHGHRRPKNDFDACKSDQDCSEGPCVNGFCTKPNHHH